MTSYYLVMCINENEQTPCCQYVAQTLNDAKTQMASCISNCINTGQAAYPSATFSSQISNDELASIVIMQNSNSRDCIINNITYPEIPIVNIRQTVYSKMYISTVAQ